MLIGSYTSSFKKDRRVAVPANFRKELGKNLILAKWYESCLVLISADRWSTLLNKVTGKSRFVTQSVRNTDRFILGSAYELETDAQGRILVPAMLTEYAKLKKEAIFVGLGDRVEIWEKSMWEQQEKLISLNASSLMEELAKEERKSENGGTQTSTT